MLKYLKDEFADKYHQHNTLYASLKCLWYTLNENLRLFHSSCILIFGLLHFLQALHSSAKQISALFPNEAWCNLKIKIETWSLENWRLRDWEKFRLRNEYWVLKWRRGRGVFIVLEKVSFVNWKKTRLFVQYGRWWSLGVGPSFWILKNLVL